MVINRPFDDMTLDLLLANLPFCGTAYARNLVARHMQEKFLARQWQESFWNDICGQRACRDNAPIRRPAVPA